MKLDMVSSSGTMQTIDNRTNDVKVNAATESAIELSKLGKAVDILNEKADQEDNYDVRFAIYKDTNRVIVQVVDKITNQVISTYPPEQILKMAEMVDQEFKVIDKKI